MRRLAARLLVLVALLVGIAAASGSAAAATPRFSQAELEGELMCPTCGEALDMSHAPVADRIRAYIANRRAAGWTKKQTKDALVQQFGPSVLATPPHDAGGNLIWAIPVIAVAAGIAVAAVALRRRRRAGLPPPDAPDGTLPPDDDERVATALARYDDVGG
jgi:cytochrome c-type biogenesis protein CcmH